MGNVNGYKFQNQHIQNLGNREMTVHASLETLNRETL